MKIPMFGASVTNWQAAESVPSTSFAQMPVVAEPKILNDFVVFAAGV
jgi:hypothetical protein